MQLKSRVGFFDLLNLDYFNVRDFSSHPISNRTGHDSIEGSPNKAATSVTWPTKGTILLLEPCFKSPPCGRREAQLVPRLREALQLPGTPVVGKPDGLPAESSDFQNTFLVGCTWPKHKHKRPPDAIPPTAFVMRVPLNFEVQ